MTTHPTPEEHPVTDPTERPLVEAYGLRLHPEPIAVTTNMTTSTEAA